MTNALGFLPFANGVHYDSEAQRRPLLQQLVGIGTLSDRAFATDDHAGIWYENETPTEVVTDSIERWPSAKAYLVRKTGSGASEIELPVGRILADLS